MSKVGSLIGAFERGEPLSDHWFQKLVAVLQPEQAALQRWVELDLAEAQEQKRLARQACANQSIEPHLSIRCMPGFGLTIAVPAAHRGSREQSEAWAAAELQRFRGLHGTLIWSRGEQTFYAPNGARPRRQDLAPA